MSEFQYYEFQAIDRPLDTAAQNALRDISSRAEITSHSLVNVYHWGSFKADPKRLIEQYFDLFIYWANWGSRTLMLRLPGRFVDNEALKPYLAKEALEIRTINSSTILTIEGGMEEPADLYDPDQHGSLSPALAMLRSDLLQGDLRCLYLAWLLGVQNDQVPDEAIEPPRPPGLAYPSESLNAFVRFFELDPDLLAAACEPADSNEALPPKPTSDDLRTFIAALPDAEKTELLQCAVLERDPHLALTLEQRWKTIHGGSRQIASRAPRRAVREIRAAVGAQAEKRKHRAEEQKAAEQARFVEAEQRERERRIALLVGKEDETWRKVDQMVESKRSADYDAATEFLQDLRVLAERTNSLPEYRERLTTLRNRHLRKPAFLNRIRTAGLHKPTEVGTYATETRT